MIKIHDIDQESKDVVFGYIKSIANDIRNIPKPLQFIVLMYYFSRKTLVYAIGCNEDGQFALHHQNNVDKLTPQKHQHQIQHIYNGCRYVIYSDYQNKNYWSTGNNAGGICCLPNDTYKQINKLTKITSFIDNDITIKYIFTNNNSCHTFWMDIEHNIYGTGNNMYHQLGLADDNLNKIEGIQIKYLKNIKDIQCTIHYTLALDHNNNVYSTGYGEHGGVGHGRKNKQISLFTIIKELNNKKIIKIKTGLYHSLFLSSNYNLYSCGSNEFGQRGEIDCDNEYRPVIIEYFNKNNIKLIDIECGYFHNLCCDINGNIYSFGWNKYGQCGLGLNSDYILIPQQINVLKNEKIILIKCGSHHSYCLSSSNNHYLWGSNKYNECIIKTTDCKPVTAPHLMNKIIATQVNNQRIQGIFLGYYSTQIIVKVDK